MLSQSYLKSILHYNPSTGIFTYINDGNNQHVKKGKEAGHNNGFGYRRIQINQKLHMSHRLAFLYMEGKFPPHQVDHINHVGTDNRWCNLRHATRTINYQNKSLYKNNKSGKVGVTFDKRDSVWVARIQVNKTPIHLGFYDNIDEAISARQHAERLYGFHANHGS